MAENFEDKKLDSPLIVHKVTDASYQEMASEVSVDFTHSDGEGTATLQRHRYRKVKKPKKWPYILIAIVVAVIILITTLYFSGVIKKPNFGKEKETQPTGYVTNEENRYKGIITVKNTYVFFEGREIDGASDLANEIKYLDPNTKFVVQDEKADEKFLNQEILPTLDSYNIKYDVKYVVSSGLDSKHETTDNQDEVVENNNEE